MENNINFKLEFGKNKLEVIFDQKSEKPFIVIGGNGDSWKAAAFCNAIGEMINLADRKYKVMGAGTYLHQDLNEILDEGFPVQNAGYMKGFALVPHIELGTVSCKTEIEEGATYKLYSGFGTRIDAARLNVVDYTDLEPDWADHNRKAFYLVENLDLLRRAGEKGRNIRLVYNDEKAGRFLLMKEQWDLYLAGKFTELAENIRVHVSEGSMKKAIGKDIRRNDALREMQAPTQLPFVEGTITVCGDPDIDMDAKFEIFKDQKIHLVEKKTGRELPSDWYVTEANFNSLVKHSRARGYKWLVCVESDEVKDVEYTSTVKSSGKKAAKK